MKLSDLVSDIETRLDSIEQKLNGIEPDSQSDTESETWMPPQQQKLELLKKAVGVESEYDDEDEEEQDCGCDELATLKRNAGILDDLSSDNPLE